MLQRLRRIRLFSQLGCLGTLVLDWLTHWSGTWFFTTGLVLVFVMLWSEYHISRIEPEENPHV